ncbi:MAG: hypothetical protein ACD_7C00520G0002 [uncultured bacterium]|nr:MAG: hypothetical protein ACD_7C00520G0002 [uncultured bacterium]
MLSLESLKEFTKKYQTKEANIFREYVQHLFLSYLYQIPASEKLLFKGGTALRVIYQSPRFSEDLDFTGQNIYSSKILDDLFVSAIAEIEKLGLKIEFTEAKPTTGGYLGIIHYELYNFSDDIYFEVSLRRGREQMSEITSIASDYLPSYSLFHLSGQEIIKGKIAALLDRKKPRDYYDLYFSLRHSELNKYIPKKVLKEVKDNLAKTRINFKKELSVLLPISHHMMLKDFKDILMKEMIKYI